MATDMDSKIYDLAKAFVQYLVYISVVVGMFIWVATLADGLSTGSLAATALVGVVVLTLVIAILAIQYRKHIMENE